MIISHKHKFIFIKTSKTAGTSLEIYLSQFCGEKDIITPILGLALDNHTPQNYMWMWNPFPELFHNNINGLKSSYIKLKNIVKLHKYYNHIPASDIKRRIPSRIWNNYFKFCVERNPWDKTLSHYHMLNNRSDGNISLEKYFKKGFFCLNYPKYLGKKDVLLVDKVLYYESLADDLSETLPPLGVPFDGSLTVKARSKDRKDRTPYQKVFSRDQKQILDKVFAKEIALHNYTF